jgi:preprotein translocase subunit SecF
MKPIYPIMFAVSMTLVLVAVVVWASFGLGLGVDFRGGSVTEIEFLGGRPDAVAVQTVLAKNPTFKDLTVSSAGAQSLIIRAAELTETDHQALLSAVNAAFKNNQPRESQFDSVGPAIGNELKSRSLWAIILVLFAISIYIALMFRAMRRVLSPWALSFATMAALAHDVLLPIGLFAALGHWGGVEINAVFVAAILTIMGYSISDTVVVFDRVRENILRGVKGTFGEVVHLSIMQTLARSIATNITTLLSLIAIYFFGGSSIRYFALALIVGIFSGAYSSIFVASPILVWLGGQRSRR